MNRNRHRDNTFKEKEEHREVNSRADYHDLNLEIELAREFLDSFQSQDYQLFKKLKPNMMKEKHHYYYNEQFLKSKEYVYNVMIYLVCSYESSELNQLFRNYLSFIKFRLIDNEDFSQLPSLIGRLSEEDYLSHKKLEKALLATNVNIKNALTAFFQEGSAVKNIDQKARNKLETKWKGIQIPLLLAVFLEFEQQIFFLRRQDLRKRLGFKYTIQQTGSEKLKLGTMQCPPHLLEALRSITKGSPQKERNLDYNTVCQGLQVYLNNACSGMISRESIHRIHDRLREMMQVDDTTGISMKNYPIEKILPWLAIQISAEVHNNDLDPFPGLGDLVHYHGAAIIDENFLETELSTTPLNGFTKKDLKRYLNQSLRSAMPFLKDSIINKMLPNIMRQVNDNMREDVGVVVKRILQDLCLKEAIMQAPSTLLKSPRTEPRKEVSVPNTNKFVNMEIEKQAKIKKVLLSTLSKNIKKAEKKVEKAKRVERNADPHQVSLERKLFLEKNAREIDLKVRKLQYETDLKKSQEKKESANVIPHSDKRHLQNRLMNIFDTRQNFKFLKEEQQGQHKDEYNRILAYKKNLSFDLNFEEKVPRFTPTAILENHRNSSPFKKHFKPKEHSRDCACLIF